MQLSTSSKMPLVFLVLFIVILSFLFLSTLSAIAGIQGVLQQQWRKVRFFAVYAIIDVLINIGFAVRIFWEIWAFNLYQFCYDFTHGGGAPPDMTFDDCLLVMRFEESIVALFAIGAVILKIHFAAVIWNCATVLRQEREAMAIRSGSEDRGYGTV